jgi:hypothetical protein
MQVGQSPQDADNHGFIVGHFAAVHTRRQTIKDELGQVAHHPLHEDCQLVAVLLHAVSRDYILVGGHLEDCLLIVMKMKQYVQFYHFQLTSNKI